VDQEADPGDQQDEHGRERVEQQAHLDPQVPYRDQLPQGLGGAAGLAAGEPDEHEQPQHEGGSDAGAAEQVGPAVGAPPGDQQHRGARRRDRHQQPDQIEHWVCPQYLRRFASSTLAERRVRKISMMMASPTTTSAAATTITKNAITWPCRSPCIRANVTSARFAAFSISSMHMNSTIALRRTSTPTAPITNSSADSAR